VSDTDISMKQVYEHTSCQRMLMTMAINGRLTRTRKIGLEANEPLACTKNPSQLASPVKGDRKVPLSLMPGEDMVAVSPGLETNHYK
jgi:hypothetical protein